ncbi:MAG: Uma2 family endonuclease [Planctomycetota bacterium]
MAIYADSKVKLTYAEYRQFPKDGRRHEIIDGDHFAQPTPPTYHQTVSRRILFQIYEQLEKPGLGEVYDAPTDLQLTETDIVQPDLIVVLKRERKIVTPTKIKGIPDLVVEILSESTERTDRTLKLELYRRTRVPEYWIVDPTDHLVEQYILEGDQYRLAGKPHDQIAFQGAPGVTVDLDEVW